MEFEYLNLESFIMAQRILECCPDLLYTIDDNFGLTLSVKNVGKHNLYNFCICQIKFNEESSPYEVLEETNKKRHGTTDNNKFYDKSVLPVGMCYSYNIDIYTWKYGSGDTVTREFEVECQDAFGTSYIQKITVTVTIKEEGFLNQYNNIVVKCNKPTVKRGVNAR